MDMDVFMTGGTGFVGTTLSTALAARGSKVTVLTRSAGRDRNLPAGVTLLEGDPTKEGSWQEKATEHDVIVNMAGASIFKRWSRDTKNLIRDSRILTTRHLAEAVSRRGEKKSLFLSTSAVGYYGFRGDEPLDESSSPGDDFLADVCSQWEAETRPAARSGARVAICRFGIVMGTRGGALGEMLPLFRKGLGSPLGSGKQWVSWIHEKDLVNIYLHLMERSDMEGPINCTAPNPVRNRELAEALAAAVEKPALLPAVPGFMLKLIKGEVGSILLKGQKVLPEKLMRSGFRFEFETIGDALADLV
jgi:uncharacterized protein (TIGR01777 family)